MLLESLADDLITTPEVEILQVVELLNCQDFSARFCLNPHRRLSIQSHL